MKNFPLDRRDFLKQTGLSIGALAGGATASAQTGARVAIIVDSGDAVAAAVPVRWAAQELHQALAGHGITANQYESLRQAGSKDLCIVLGGHTSSLAAAALKKAGLSLPDAPDSLALAPLNESGRQGLLACGSNVRGAMYAALELADRVSHAANPMDALTLRKATAEQPANSVRSVSRLFVSDVEDKPWFNDREMWPAYLTMLAGQRFNRFNLALGIGYDFLRAVTDAYFLFAYPFLLSVPGYNVRASNLPDTERDRNLETLKFISEQTTARGLEFQLGIWMHGYQWINSPNPNYTIEGLTADNHAAYCRDALAELLKACPAISGITFRIHGESGVAEGSYPFWKTVFDGVVRSGRKVEIDMHAKGIDQDMIDVGLATGMPVRVSPKFWAEHMGMPYHQADIRDQEIPHGRTAQGLMALSTGSRSFTRYGYADLMREDRRYSVVHRIWPGTQRLLIWGDPLTAAAYSRAFGFCGSSGAEIMEPLSFKGRRGSGIAGDRCGYADASLKPRWDWEKYLYSYRVWGRLLYHPEADPDSWQRALRSEFQAGAPSAEAALASASRILPTVTSAHDPSAANNTYWPEVYTNQPIVDPGKKNPYTDTPSPKTFGNTGALDPQLFSRINDFADELVKRERSGKYSPVEVAQWLEDLSETAVRQFAEAGKRTPAQDTPAFRRLAIDIRIQAGLGRFFAAKLRSGVLYAIHERTGDRAALEEALKQYRTARDAWAQIVNLTKSVYVPDITVGELPWLRGHWADRLPAIDGDLADMAKKLEAAPGGAANEAARAWIAEASGRPHRAAADCRHTPLPRFQPGQPLEVELSVDRGRKLTTARLYYRHINQAERFQMAEMQAADNRYRAAIPAGYTSAPFPLQYYFELKETPEKAWLYPGFAADWASPPYFVVRRSS